MTTSFQKHLAIFGGSFNPPHLGHRVAIEGLMKNPGVARVMVVPSYGTPLKKVQTSFEHRFQMAKMSFSDVAEVSSIENENKIEFTWQLLASLRGSCDQAAFVIGTDQLVTFKKWNRFPEVLGMTDWIVLLRKSDKSEEHAAALRTLVSDGVLAPTREPQEWKITGSAHLLKFVETDAPLLSSTLIRENYALGRSEQNHTWVSKPVIEYIERNHLYGT